MSLKEDEIRPDRLKAAQMERFAADVRRLVARKDRFVRVPCPACGGAGARTAFEKHGLSYVLCDGCETMYVNPRPTPVLLEDYYATSENYAYWNKHIFPASEGARREKIFRPRAERLAGLCKRHGAGRGTLVEVGAGFGTFCEEVRRMDLFREVVAVEPTPDLAETCRKKGLKVIQKPVEQAGLEGLRADVVASFEVIEHLFSPAEFIRACASALSPGGLLVLTCPNVKGFDVQVLGAASDTVDAEHLNYFHPASLSGLLKGCGFEVLEASTPGELDAELVRKKILAGEFDASGQPFLRRLLIDEWEKAGEAFQSFLADHGLSSHMWLVARKAP